MRIQGKERVTLLFVDDDGDHRTDDAFEWTFTLLLSVHVLTTAQRWKNRGRSSLELN
ncbi:MAG: hypothetical protein V7752_16445 [Halopseudomonas sp.]